MFCRRATLWLLLALAFGAAGGAHAQLSNPDALFSARLESTDEPGYEYQLTIITCRGYPTCTGTYRTVVRFENCSNDIAYAGSIVINGLNLAQTGTIAGSFTIAPSFTDFDRLPGGTCQIRTVLQSETFDYAGTWDRRTQTGNVQVRARPPFTDIFDLPFRVDITAAAPVFPLTVKADIGPQRANVVAELRYRPQDVGRLGSVYVFASAPAPQVRGALAAKTVNLGAARYTSPVAPKADPPPCVLAQMTPTGLQAVSIGQLQAFSSGTFNAAGASVSILDNVPTPSVAGATFYVGYGSTGPSMINDGIFRNAVLVPGSSVCPPLPYQTSLWWNPEESGWGLNVNQQGSLVFATLFTYDASRAPMWLAMSAGALQSDGLTFSGDLYRTTGPPFNASPFTPIGAANVTRVGAMSIRFTEANAATLTYTNNGVEVTKSIQRQVFGARAANCMPTTEDRVAASNYQDLWWIPSESGWGLNVTHQDGTLFATLFTYDAAGRGLWLVLPSGARQGDGSYFGDLYRTSGPPFNALPFTPIGGADIANVGTMRLRFTDGNNGTLTYTFNGTQVVKSITRQVFSTPVSLCN